MTRVAIDIRQAIEADVEIVAGILGEAADWLAQHRTPLWRSDEVTTDRIEADVRDGLFFIAASDGETAGTVKFQLTDREFWPDVPDDESAFVHRLAVRRRFAGGIVSSALVHWAAERASAMGRRYLRLDCDASRERLRAVYTRMGFEHHSNRMVGPYFVARYQLRLP